MTDLISGQLRIGMINGCTVTPLFDALAAFHRAHPGVDVSLLEDHSDRLVEAVRGGTVDLALIGTSTERAESTAALDILTIITERLVVAVPTDHPLAHQRQVTLRDLTAHPIVCMPPGTGLRTVFDDACAAQRLHPSITLQATAADALADLAARGLAVAILTDSMATHYADRLTTRTIEDIDTPASLALAWRPSPAPAVHRLLTHCRHAFGVPGPEPGRADTGVSGGHGRWGDGVRAEKA